MMQRRINEHGGIELPLPKRVKEGVVPEKPKVFPERSVKNPKEATWRIGGAGAWWPGRMLEAPLEAESISACAGDGAEGAISSWTGSSSSGEQKKKVEDGNKKKDEKAEANCTEKRRQRQRRKKGSNSRTT